MKTDWIGRIAIIVTGVLIFGGGCSHTAPSRKPEPAKPATEAGHGPGPLYYDFNDVLIPGELNLDRGASFVYQANGVAAGVQYFEGRVETQSLLTFFGANMVRDNWRLVGSIKSARTMLLFQKDNRWCVIGITEKDLFSTEVEIWLAPTNGVK